MELVEPEMSVSLETLQDRLIDKGRWDEAVSLALRAARYMQEKGAPEADAWKVAWYMVEKEYLPLGAEE